MDQNNRDLHYGLNPQDPAQTPPPQTPPPQPAYQPPQTPPPQPAYQPPQTPPPQPAYQPPQYGAPQYVYPLRKKNSGKAIAGMVLGIGSIVVTSCGLICAILGLIFSILGRRECLREGREGRGMAIAGIICSSIGLAIGLLSLVIFLGALLFSFGMGLGDPSVYYF